MPKLNQFMRDVIVEGYARGLPIAEIAALAGTTYDSCRATASRLKLKHPNRVRPTNSDPKGWVYNSQPASAPVSPQYKAWQRAKNGAAEALREFQ